MTVSPASPAAGPSRETSMSTAVTEITGVRYNPLRDDRFSSRDVSVNYMAVGVKEGA